MATYYWVGGNGTWDGSSTANWSNATGGASGFGPPLSTDTVIFDSASGTGTCTTAAGSACTSATLNSSTLGLTLGANHTMGGQFTHTSGTLTLGTYTLTCLRFNSQNSNVRTIAFDTGNIIVTGDSSTVWTTSTTTNLTVTGTPVVNCTYAGSTGTRTITPGTVAGGPQISFNISSGSDIVTSAGTPAFNNLNFTGFTGTLSNTARNIYGNLTLSSGMTLTAGPNATTFAATSGTQQITTNGKTLDFPLTFNGVGGTVQLQDNLTLGSTRTVTLTNGTIDLNNKTLSTGLFSSSNSNTRSIAFGTGNITLTGNNGTIFNGGGATTTGITITGTPTINCTYSGSTGTRTITGGSRSILTETQTFSFNVSAGSDIVVLTGANAYRSLDFTGFTGTLTNNAVTVYGDLKISSGMILTSSSNTLTFSSSLSTNTITTSGQTLDFPLTFNKGGGVWSFADALTQGSTRAFTITSGTVKLKAGATSTVGAFATSGSNQKYLQSTTAGSQATLSQASGTVTVSYLTIRDIAATGGATWNAYVDYNNVDQGDNTGWDFSNSPAIDNEFPIALRSFTQPKRF